MKPGDRVTVTFYGEVREGIVTRVSNFVWVKLDAKPGTSRAFEVWFHPESVTPVTDAQKQEG